MKFTPTATDLNAKPSILDLDVIYFGTADHDFNFCSPDQFKYNEVAAPTTAGGVTTTMLDQPTATIDGAPLTLVQTVTGAMTRYLYTFTNNPPKANWAAPFVAPMDLTFKQPNNVEKVEPTPNAAPVPFAGYDFSVGGVVVLSTKDMGFAMGRQFARYSFNIFTDSALPTGMQLWGLGEQVTDQFFLQDGIYSFWNRDNNTPNYSTQSLPGKNIYGTHPFMMYKAAAGAQTAFVGVFFNSAHAMDVSIVSTKKTTGTAPH